MPFSTKAIANYFLDLAKAKGVPLTPMKLQKLVYFAHGWHLALADTPLIDEQVEAWRYGPVIRSLYRVFKEFGNSPIERKAKHYFIERDGERIRFRSSFPSIDTDGPQDADRAYAKTLMNRIWELYGGFSAVQLSKMTHAEGTPWKNVSDRYGGVLPKGTDIPQEEIRAYFTSMLAV